MTPFPEQPPPGARPPGPLRLAAMGDLHVGENDRQPYRQVFADISAQADVLAICGDLTNYGKTHEVEILAEDLMTCAIPVVGVLGNHDYECGQHQEVCRILTQAGVRLLEGEAYEIHGVGFAGCKGFVGGYGRYMLSAFGEHEIKAFVQASVDENLKLETSLRMLRTDRAVVVLHYSPIPDTLIGEPPEIFPFLGCSRMAETIDRFENVGLVVHGHAHRGTYSGRTPRGAPVFNVSLPVLMRDCGRPFVVYDV
jgi:Icc-related predicted phosphoesterase